VVRKRVRVHGRVQGVWFRASAEREAVARRVGGFARNERDGSVLLELEGAPDDVAAVVTWCHVGPPRAVVERVEVEDLPPEGGRSFRTS